MISIRDNLKFLHNDHKAIVKEAKEIHKSATKHFQKYDASNISEHKKLIIDLRDICENFDNEEEQ